MEAIQKFSAGQLNQATFECQLQGAFFLAAASSYMVMGTMLGYRCRRHFQHFLLVEAEPPDHRRSDREAAGESFGLKGESR